MKLVSNDNRYNLKNEKGITMITLMVTVVILIILAGIAVSSMNTGGINQVKGDKANLAKTENSVNNDIDKLYNNLGQADPAITADFDKTTSKIMISNIHTYNKNIASETYTIQIRPVNGTYSTVETGKTSSDKITISNLQQSKTYMIKIIGSLSNLTTEKSITTDTLEATKLKMIKANGSEYTSDTWTNDYVDISLEDSKYDSTYASITGSVQAINTTAVTTRINTLGKTKIRVTTSDGTSTATKDYAIVIDNVKPTVTMAMKKGSSSGENYTSNTWSNQDIFIGSTSSDADSGIRSTSITLDGCKTTSTTMMITTEGTHTLKISAEDYAGNVSESDEAIIKIDKTNPNSNIVLNNQQTKTITKKVANETTTTYIATNNNLEDSENGPLRMETIPADGTYKIMVYGAAGTDSINSPTYGMSKGGKGALVYGTFQFKANDMLVIGIGTKGTITGTLNSGATDAVSGPGGGLSFVAKYEDDKMNTLLMAAGGNGGNDTLSQHTIKNGADGICTAGTNNDGLNMINNQSEEFVNQATISKNGLTSTTGLFLGKAEDDNNSAGGGAQIGDGANNTGAYSYITSSATDTGGESGNNSDTGKIVLIREDYTDVTYTASVIDFNLSATDQVSKISLDNSKYFIDDDSNLKGVNSTSWNSAKNLQSENFETTEEITQDGKHYIHLLAKDNANNYSEKIKEIISDTTAPTITITSSGVDSYPDILTVNVTDNVAGTKNIELPDGSIINTNGSMNYTTTYNVTKNGPLTFKSTDMQGNIQVLQYQEENVINFETEWTISSANTNITLPLYGVTDVYVDYGDGTKTAIKDTLSMTTTDGKVFTGNCPTHTYSAVGTYKIKISGNCEQYLFNDSSENYLTKIDKWGCLQNTRYAFGGNYYDLEPGQYMEHYSDIFSTGSSNIRGSIPAPNIHSFEKLSTADYMFTACGFEGNIPTGLFDSAINVKSYNGTFANCGLLTGSIPAGLFSKSTKVTEFSNTFKYCRKLTGSIPENIFSANTELITVDSVFYMCDGLTGSIPENIFANNTKLINELGSFALCDSLTGNIPTGIFANNLDIEYIMSTFTYCSGLTGSIPAEIFKNNTKVKDISGVFDDCTNLSGTIPSNIFNYNTNVTTFYDVFGNCKGITGTIPENLFANNVNLTDMYGMFYGCSGITGTIPGNLFANNVNLKTLRGIFNECSNISGTVPENLLINNIKIEDINSLFRKCTQITQIPTNIFINNTLIKNIDSTFYGCTGLTSIPENIFANNISITTSAYTFYGCTGLTSIPANIFANNISITSAAYTFYGCTGLTAIPANIFANNNLITNFSYTFKGCTQLTGNAPELWNRSNVNNYLECFKDDTKLTNYSTIPASWK